MAPSGGHDRARHGSPGAIPHTVSDYPCIDFVNSRFTDHTGTGRVHDRLELEEWRRWFVLRCGFATHWPLGEVVHRELEALRSLLRMLLESGAQPDDESVARINRYLLVVSQSWELTRDPRGLQLIPRWSDDGWSAVMASVASSYVSLLLQGGAPLVRVCANPDCSFMFYDDTRNRSRRWCDVAICGNLLKVRRHRAQMARPVAAPRRRGQGAQPDR